MGSKARPLGKDTLSGLAAEEFSGRATLPSCPMTNRLIGRIAEALQVSPAALYNPLEAVAIGRGADTDKASSTSLDQDCLALLHAYRRIQDPKERQRLLALVQEAAERT